MIRHTNAHNEILAVVVMTTKKGRTLDYRNNQKVNGKGSEEYDLVQYYGDETFLKIDTFENQRNILQARISGLEWRNKAFLISGIVLAIFSLGLLILSIIQQLKIQETVALVTSLQRLQYGIEVRLDSEPKGKGPTVEEFVSEISLLGGDGKTYGNLFVYGNPVCDDGWNSNAATVACKMLGFDKVIQRYFNIL